MASRGATNPPQRPYPEARVGGDVDVLHGHAVPDPYRWLEDAGSADTEAWSAAQDELLARWLEEPTRARRREHLAARVRDLLPGFVGLPAARGERLFFERRSPDQDHPALIVRAPEGDRVLLDPSDLSPDHTTTLDGWWPSNDGRLLAYVVSEGGDEQAVLHVLDTTTGDRVDGPVRCGRGPDVAWFPAGDRYLYVRADEDQFNRRVWCRTVSDGAEELWFGDGRDKTTYYAVGLSRDGRWATISASLGTAPRNDLYLADLTLPERRWVPIQEGEDVLTDAHVADGRLYLRTNRDAPCWRLAVTAPTQPAPEHWRDLVPEVDAVLESYALTEDVVVVCRTRNVVAELDIVDKATGELVGALSLPGLGTAAVASRPEGGHDLWVSYTDFLTPPRVLHADVSADAVLELWAAPAGTVTFPDVPTRQVWVESTDGANIPMFVIGHGGRPTVLNGYGGFNIALTPTYSATVAAWVEAGGAWAVANLRGGAEFGEDWHRDGMRSVKQHVFDDFAACARRLLDDGASAVGVYGGSNGGLLVGATLTQHPNLVSAVVCSAPLLDMVRYERFGLGETWNDEYGSAADPEQLSWLLGYSPYHHVAAGVRYPATLFTVFDSDTRVDPLHARKMCAALQAATAAPFEEAPVLLRRERDVGHGARSVSRTAALAGDILAFLADRLGAAAP